MKGNEENRGLNDKKAYEDQFIDFVNSNLELSLYSLILSYSCTLRVFLEHFGIYWIWRKKEKKIKKVKGDSGINRDQ